MDQQQITNTPDGSTTTIEKDPTAGRLETTIRYSPSWPRDEQPSDDAVADESATESKAPVMTPDENIHSNECSRAPAPAVVARGRGSSEVLDGQVERIRSCLRDSGLKYAEACRIAKAIDKEATWQQRTRPDGKMMHDNFRQFVKNELAPSLGVKSPSAIFDMVRIVEEGLLPDVEKYGPTMARLLAGTPPDKRDDIRTERDNGATTSQIKTSVTAAKAEDLVADAKANGEPIPAKKGRKQKLQEQIDADIAADKAADDKTKKIVEATKAKVATVTFDVVDGVKQTVGSKVVTRREGTFVMAMATFDCRECGHESITVQINADGLATIRFNKKREGSSA